MTREEFSNVLQDEINKNANLFADTLRFKKEQVSVEQMVADAYNMAVSDAALSLVSALEKAGILKYDD